MDEDSAFSAADLSNLIGLIYDTAGDHALWPRLLEAMARYLAWENVAPALGFDPMDGERMVASWFDGSGVPLPLPLSKQERLSFAHLAPHFVRANELQRQVVEASEHKRLLERSLDQLPLGIAVTDGEGAIVSINRALLSMLHRHDCLSISAGRLVSRPRRVIGDALHTVVAENGPDVPLRLEDKAGSLSVWISHLAAAEGSASDGRAVVWVARRDAPAIAESGLCALFGTTPAEARLVQRLMTGVTLEEAASELGTSVNTVKTQLKAVFAKVGVRRQSELMQAVYSTPLWLDFERDPSGEPGGAGFIDLSRLPGSRGDGCMVLADGRRLFWSDTGDPMGLAVILMHGFGCSRHMRHPDEGILHEERIRLIIPERPGTGDSDPHPGRRVADWARDVEAMADHLRLRRFVVLGYSAGTAYALMTAQHLPKRVLSVHVVGTMPPIERLEDVKVFSGADRMVLLVARLAPNLLPPLMRFVIRGVLKDVYGFIRQDLRRAPESDRRVLDNPVFRENLAQGLLATVRHGEQFLVSEVLLIAQGWSVDAGKLPMPVRFYHGEADSLVAPDGARRLASQIPGATLHMIPGAGHLVLYSHWREILRLLRDGIECDASAQKSAISAVE